MKVQKKPAAGGGRFSSKGEKAETEAHQNSRNSDLPQGRRPGASRRLVDGRWQAPAPNTAMAAALIKAARPRKRDPEQILLSDFGIMPDPHKKSED
jgi:hypothetical protein